MRKLKIYLFIFVFLFPLTVFAQTENQEISQEELKTEFYEGQEISPRMEIPPGMEEIQIGGSAKLIVPKGAKTKKVGAQVIVEGSKEYMSRRFLEMEEKFNAMEKRQEELEKEIKALKSSLEEIKSVTAQPQQNSDEK